MDIEKLEHLINVRDELEEKLNEIESKIIRMADSCPLCRNNHYPHCNFRSTKEVIQRS